MSITVKTLSDSQGHTDAKVVIIDHQFSFEAFQALVQRGANLWPDAPPEIKEFADLVTNGVILQNYRGQDTSPSKKQGDSNGPG